jgi:NADH-quinone oxidoreductase subunit L
VVDDQAALAPYIVALPLAGAVVMLLFGKRLGRVSGPLACTTIGLSFVLGVVTFLRVVSGYNEAIERIGPVVERGATVRIFEWIAAGDFRVGADLLVDQLSMVMVLVVTGVGFLIHVYSIGYMHSDERYSLYFAYLNLFAASMLLLVLADNVLLLYVGWEAVGLCSYLLIGFWFERPAAANAAKKAFLVNRLGDFAFLLGIFLLVAEVSSLTVGRVNEAAGGLSAGIATAAALLLFAGATGKSAQIPLYVWLPDAMEGPTPVSALIHAATMVTAGVYVVARFGPVFEASGGVGLEVVAWIGALTALWAALLASAEYDIKRVLAYSTISQLGYMFLANGVGAYSIAIFHLVTHAFFKALMFLGAGAVMHALGGEIDMRKMSGLRRVMPLTGATFAAGWLAISGIVPFSGFFSKDAILASAWQQGRYALWGIGVATAALTAFYMSRLYFRVFEGNVELPGGAHPHDAPPTMAAALVPLAGLSLIGGIVNLPGVLTLEHFLEPVVGHSEAPRGLAPWLLGGVALLAGLLGILAAWGLYGAAGANRRRAAVVGRLRPLVSAARGGFYVDRVYGRGLVLPGKALANLCAYAIDARGVDGVVNGLGRLVAGSAEGLRRLQSGYVRNYAATFLLGVVAIFSVLVVRVTT